MPSPLDVLKDPNYIKANTATKQAIFNSRVATLPEYRSANPATQADIRRRFNIETGKEKYIRQTRQRAEEEKSALRNTGGKISSFVSGAERGLKSVADKLSYLNPLEYIPVGQSDQTKKRLANYAAERQRVNPNTFAGGRITGEIVGTLPLTMGGGKAVELTGRALTKFAPRFGAVVEKTGRTITSGGTGVAAPTRAAETSGKIIAQTRKARNAYRAAGGAGSSTIAAAMTDQDLTDAALSGATVPVLGHILKFGAGKTYDLIAGRAGPVEAARILREVISNNASKIEKALRNAPKNIKANTAEFLASRGLLRPELAAATRIASASKQSAPLLAVAQQRAAGQNRMREIIAGGENQTASVRNIAATKKALQDETKILRDQNLGLADVGRQQIVPAEQKAAAAAALARELENSARRLTGAGKYFGDSPMFTSGADQATYSAQQAFADARSAEEVAANLRAQGLAPLDVSQVVANLRTEADKAQFVSPDRYKILSEFANNLQRRAEKFGNTIDAEGLYLARREMGAFVSSILGTSDPKALRAGTSQLVAAAQQPIDDAIVAAGGAGWKNYLNTFAEGMKGIERQTFQRELTKLPEARFAKVMAGEDPDFVESILGPGRYDINVEMQGADLATANKLGRDIEAQRKVSQTGLDDLSQSQKLNFAQGAGAKVGEMFESPAANAFTAGARLVGSIPKIGGGGVAAQQFGVRQAEKASERTMGALVPALASPRAAGDLLRVRPAEDYVSKLLYGTQGAAPLTSAPRQIRPQPFAVPPQNLRAEQAVANRNALSQPQKDILNQNAMSQARQQAVSQMATQNLTPPTIGQEFGFPDFDPESGNPLVDIDFSEGYPVPIYGTLPKDMRFKSSNFMRR